MKLKPYKDGYLFIFGKGNFIFLNEMQLKIMRDAYEELKNVKDYNRQEFEL